MAIIDNISGFHIATVITIYMPSHVHTRQLANLLYESTHMKFHKPSLTVYTDRISQVLQDSSRTKHS